MDLLPFRITSSESPIGPEDPTSNLSTYDVWTLVAPFADFWSRDSLLSRGL